jgi:secreted PhoX family phosphatase
MLPPFFRGEPTMAKDFELEDSNRSSNPSIHEISDPRRRVLLRAGAGAIAAAPLAQLLAGCASATRTDGPLIGFKSVPVSTADTVTVPEGYVATPAFMWGEPVGVPGNMPPFKPDASNTAAEQEVQVGMHHDGMHYFALDGSRRGLLVFNNEYTDDGLLHPDGMKTWNAEKVRKSIAAHGVTILEIEDRGGQWQIVRPSRYARRITAATPMAMSGPAAAVSEGGLARPDRDAHYATDGRGEVGWPPFRSCRPGATRGGAGAGLIRGAGRSTRGPSPRYGRSWAIDRGCPTS